MPIPLRTEGDEPGITFVVGKAMKVGKVPAGERISRDMVEETHRIYYERVQQLYEKYKGVAGYQDKPLVLEHKS